MWPSSFQANAGAANPARHSASAKSARRNRAVMGLAQKRLSRDEIFEGISKKHSVRGPVRAHGQSVLNYSFDLQANCASMHSLVIAK